MMQTVICVTNNHIGKVPSRDLRARCDPRCLYGCYFHPTKKREADKAGAWVGARVLGWGDAIDSDLGCQRLHFVTARPVSLYSNCVSEIWLRTGSGALCQLIVEKAWESTKDECLLWIRSARPFP